VIVPVLDQEPGVWPKDLFEVRLRTGEVDPWFVCHVRTRAEKAVARRLRVRGIGYFLPQHVRGKRFQRRLVRSNLPLFPGYIFVVGNDEDHARTVELTQVVRALGIEDQTQIDRELRDIDRLLQSGMPVTREERLRPGALARVIRGPLTGLCGRVLHNRKGLRLVLEVQFLQRGVSIEVDSTAIEAV